MPVQLADVALPGEPNVLAWSGDGAYLAVGIEGIARDKNVFVVDVANASILAQLGVRPSVHGLAFSPDTKWLAVAGTRPYNPPGLAPAELVVFDMPTFTAKFRAQQKRAFTGGGFKDLAWAPGGEALYAIDDPGPQDEAAVRRWTMPAFTEQPTIPQTGRDYSALAVSPDGRTVAVADGRIIRLFDTASGAQRSSFKEEISSYRLGFSPDGKALGAWGAAGDHTHRSWYDVVTGREGVLTTAEGLVAMNSLDPKLFTFAIQPAGISTLYPRYVVFSPDFSMAAWGEEYSPGADGPRPGAQYGAFIHIGTVPRHLTWRVGDSRGFTDAPAVAFSPDGTKLAATIKQPSGSLLILAVPE
jgi:WD40 repeat protein